MPIAVRERAGSRERTEGESPSATLLFTITGTEDDDEAMAALLGTAPTIFRNLVRQTPHIEPQGAGLWYADVHYGKREPKKAGDWKFTFDTTGGTQHITQSLETIGRYAVEGNAPDFGGAIGVTQDSIEGVDIVVPAFSFGITYYFDPAFISPSYALVCYALTGRTNVAPFWGFAAGEVLFHGATGTIGGDTGVLEMNYRFTANPNVQGLQVAGMSIGFKGGHHYLWFRYQDTKDDGAKMLVKRPVAAFVERVYDPGSLSALGIG